MRTMQDTFEPPYWMKVLEERYQRLHAKVINGTMRFTANRNMADLSNARYVKLCKQTSKRNVVASVQRGGSCDVNANLEVDRACNCDHNDVGAICVHLRPVDNTNGNTKSNNNLDSAYVSSCKLADQDRGMCAGTRVDSSQSIITVSTHDVFHTPGIVSSDGFQSRLSSENDVSLEDYFYRSLGSGRKTAEVEFIDYSQDEESNDDLCDDNDGVGMWQKENMHSKINVVAEMTKIDVVREDCDDEGTCADKKQTEVAATRRRRKTQKRSKSTVHRTNKANNKSLFPFKAAEDGSQLTTKRINPHSSINLSRADSDDEMFKAILPLTARGLHESRERVFARMSFEARRAVDETLKEMKGIEVSGHDDKATNSNVRLCTHSDPVQVVSHMATLNRGTDNHMNDSIHQNTVADSIHQNKVAESTKCVEGDSNKSNQAHLPSGLKNALISPCQNHGSSHKSLAGGNVGNGATFNVKSSLKGSSQHLPQLHHNIAPFPNVFPSRNVRLPGIGKAKPPLSFRENTFEITPLNFDIRFQQIISCQSNEETLSAEILQRSIEKCNQWLVRYIRKH